MYFKEDVVLEKNSTLDFSKTSQFMFNSNGQNSAIFGNILYMQFSGINFKECLVQWQCYVANQYYSEQLDCLEDLHSESSTHLLLLWFAIYTGRDILINSKDSYITISLQVSGMREATRLLDFRIPLQTTSWHTLTSQTSRKLA